MTNGMGEVQFRHQIFQFWIPVEKLHFIAPDFNPVGNVEPWKGVPQERIISLKMKV